VSTVRRRAEEDAETRFYGNFQGGGSARQLWPSWSAHGRCSGDNLVKFHPERGHGASENRVAHYAYTARTQVLAEVKYGGEGLFSLGKCQPSNPLVTAILERG